MESGNSPAVSRRRLYLRCKSEVISTPTHSSTPKPGRHLSRRNRTKRAKSIATTTVGTMTEITGSEISVDPKHGPQEKPDPKGKPFYKKSTLLILVIMTSVFMYACIVLPGPKLCPSQLKTTVNETVLHSNLSRVIYGQPYAVHIISNAVVDASSADMQTLLLIGGSGVGKTWTTLVLSELLNKSVLTLRFSGDLHFKTKGAIEDVVLTILKKVGCSRLNLIIFDDMEGILDRVVQVRSVVVNRLRSLNYQILFLIISNTAQEQIEEVTGTLMEDGKTRFEIAKLIGEKLAVEGLGDAAVVPYLPLTTGHVEKCISVVSKELRIVITDDMVHSILTAGKSQQPETVDYFVPGGCKRVWDKLVIA